MGYGPEKGPHLGVYGCWMRVLLAFDKFKGSITARTAVDGAAAVARDLGWEADPLALSDGGDGFLDAMGGTFVPAEVHGPLGEVVRSGYSVRDGTAYIETARASGLAMIGGRSKNDPVAAETVGVGELMLLASMTGVSRIVVGCGGSATTDGGKGMLRTLGDRWSAHEKELIAAVDVRTRFLDAAMLYGPQKGASCHQVEELTGRLRRIAREFEEEFGTDVTSVDGSGAAGGLGGALHVLGARIVSGASLVMDALDFDRRLDACDVVVTGEGTLDATSFMGKVVGEVVRRAGAARRPVAVIAGHVDRIDGALMRDVLSVRALDAEVGSERAMADAAMLLGSEVERVLREWSDPSRL